MKIRFARHGQPFLDDLPPGTDYEFPPDDPVLTELGKEQAHCLGRHLKAEGFKGRIISSPFLRTAGTADIVAQECGLKFYLEPRIQEMRCFTFPYMGFRLNKLHVFFKNLSSRARLRWPWMVDDFNESSQGDRERSFIYVRARVRAFLDELVANPPAEDVLLIVHGASCGALRQELIARGAVNGLYKGWNCSLSRFDIGADGKATCIELDRIDFMPKEIVTSNKKRYLECGEELAGE